MATILVVDDELGIRDLLCEILSDEGHAVELAENAAQARQLRAQMNPDLVLLDIWMPDTDGVTLLKDWASSGLLTMPVIMMSGHATIDTAVEAIRIGATAFLEKPITLQKLLRAVDQGLHKSPPKRREDLSVKTAISATHPTTEVGAGSPIAQPELVAEVGLQASQMFNLEGPLRSARDQFEKAYFEYHLVKESGSMTRVADKTGLERTHLYRKLKQLGVDLSRSKRHKF